MALSKKALQRKREKKKSKRQAKMGKSSSMPSVNYGLWPVHECWVPTELWDTGLGSVVVTRKNNLGEIAAGVYLIDVFCLGVKNCYLRLIHAEGYQSLLAYIKNTTGELQPVEPTYAHTLIHQAEIFANQCGFAPHADFAKAKKLLKNIAIDETLEFTFGKEGRPFYIQGPSESPMVVANRLKTLALSQGTANYDYIIEALDENILPKE